MAQNLDLNVNVNTNEAGKSLGSLKKQLREAQAEVVALSDKFGATSKEAIEAAKRAAELKDQIGDAKSLVDAFNPDAKFKALTSSLAGVAGGFAAVQGAMALFGSESENVQKTLLKVQSAMALSQGLQAVGESIDSFKQLAAVVKTQVVTAFSTLRGAIIATGIGLLAVALGLVVANFESIKKVITNLFPGLGKLTDFVGGLVTKFTDFVGITSAASRALEVLQKSTKLRNEDIERQIKLLSAQGGKEKEIFTLQKESAQNEINVLKKKVDDKGKLYGADADNYKNLQNQLKVIDATEANRIKKLGEEYQKEKDAKNKEFLNAEKERLEKEAAIAKSYQDFELQRQIDANKAEDDLAEKKKEAAIKEDERNIASMKATADFEVQLANDLLKLDEENAEARKKIDIDAANIKKAQINESMVAMSQLSDFVGRETAAGKALGIATATINTYQGASEALKQKSTLPSPFDVIAKVLNVATIIATGIKTVKSIASVQIPGRFGGGGGMPTMVAPMTPELPQAATTNLSRQTINDIGNQAVRAYVIETDVTSNQERMAAIRQRARFS